MNYPKTIAEDGFEIKNNFMKNRKYCASGCIDGPKFMTPFVQRLIFGITIRTVYLFHTKTKLI